MKKIITYIKWKNICIQTRQIGVGLGLNFLSVKSFSLIQAGYHFNVSLPCHAIRRPFQ